jgi:hypothetical protein
LLFVRSYSKKVDNGISWEAVQTKSVNEERIGKSIQFQGKRKYAPPTEADSSRELCETRLKAKGGMPENETRIIR